MYLPHMCDVVFFIFKKLSKKHFFFFRNDRREHNLDDAYGAITSKERGFTETETNIHKRIIHP